MTTNDQPNAPPDADATAVLPVPVEASAERCQFCGHPANAELGSIHDTKAGRGHLVCAQRKVAQDNHAALQAQIRQAEERAEQAENKAKLAEEKAKPASACEQARVKAIEAAELVEQAEEWRDRAGDLMDDAQKGLEECQRKERERMEAAVRALKPPPAPLIDVRTQSAYRIKVGSIGGVSGIGILLLVLWVTGFFDPVEPVHVPGETTTITEPWPEPVVRFNLYKADSRKALNVFLTAHRDQLFPDQARAFQEAADADNLVLVFQVKADGTLVLLREERPNE